jgi:hypothetical protein
MNLDLSGRSLLWPLGCGGGVRVVFVVLSKISVFDLLWSSF